MEPRTLRCRYTNIYLIQTNNGWLMFDCDVSGSLKNLLQAFKSGHILLGEVNYLLISHYHPDHAGIAQDLKDLGVDLLVMEAQRNFLHVQDAVYIKANDQHFKPILEKGNRYLRFAESRAFLAKLGLQGEIMHTPGHSEDSISLVLDGQAVFHGDLPPYEQVEAWQNPLISASWTNILRNRPKFAYAGHWPKITLPVIAH